MGAKDIVIIRTYEANIYQKDKTGKSILLHLLLRSYPQSRQGLKGIILQLIIRPLDFIDNPPA